VAVNEVAALNGLVQYGVLGVLVIILIPFVKWLIKRETDRADRGEAEVKRLNQVIHETVIPMGKETERADRMEAEVNRLNSLILEKVLPAVLEANRAVTESNRLIRERH
jgi:hypothetical protein